MSKINRLPYGLQEFLGNTSAGRNPDQLLQDVRPTVDLTPHYSFERSKYAIKDTAMATTGQGSFITVPQGEIWSPLHIGGECTGFTAGNLISLRISIFAPNLAATVPIANEPVITVTSVTERILIGHSFPQRTLYGSGTIFGVYTGYYNGSASTMKMAMEYVSFKA